MNLIMGVLLKKLGDTVYLESHVVTKKKGIWKFDCSASIEDKLIAEATILCADRPK